MFWITASRLEVQVKRFLYLFDSYAEKFQSPERVISKETWRMVVEDSLIAVEDSSLSSLVAADQEALLEVIGTFI